MAYAQQQLTVYIQSRKVVRSSSILTDPDKAGRIRLYDREKRVLCLTFADDAGAAVAFPGDATFDFSVDNARSAKAEANLMAFTDNANINDTGDWADADPTAGKIGILVDCNTANFEAGLDPIDGEADIWCQLRMFPSGETNPCTLLMDSGFAFSNVIGKYVS